MLTSWGKKVLSTIRATNIIPHVTVNAQDKANITAKTIANNTKYINPTPATAASWALAASALVETGNSSTIGVVFGSGNSAESESSYMLDNLITGITAATPTIVTAYDDLHGKYIARLDYAISNDTGSEITIKEVGILVRFNTASTLGDTTSTTAKASFLIDRTLLATPVTIASGGAGVVRYEFVY